MWDRLARSSFSDWPRKQVTIHLTHIVLKTSRPDEVNQLEQ